MASTGTPAGTLNERLAALKGEFGDTWTIWFVNTTHGPHWVEWLCKPKDAPFGTQPHRENSAPALRDYILGLRGTEAHP